MHALAGLNATPEGHRPLLRYVLVLLAVRLVPGQNRMPEFVYVLQQPREAGKVEEHPWDMHAFTPSNAVCLQRCSRSCRAWQPSTSSSTA